MIGIVVFIFLVLLILVLIWYNSGNKQTHHRKQVGIIYSKSQSKIPDILTEVADLSFIKISGDEAHDLQQFMLLEEQGVDCYISELIDHEVAYVHDLYFKHNPDILHLNNGSHYDNNESNLIRNTVSDKDLALVVAKYATGKVGIIENTSDFRSKAFRSLLDFETYDPESSYDTIIALSDISDTITPKIIYPFQDKGIAIKPIEEAKERCYNLGHMLSYQMPQITSFTIEHHDSHETMAHAMIHNEECFILHHRLIDEVEHYLSSE